VVAPVGQLLVIAGVVNAGSEGFRFLPSCHEKVVSCSLSHDDDDFNHTVTARLWIVFLLSPALLLFKDGLIVMVMA